MPPISSGASKKLQRVQNCAAHLLCNASKYDHITPILFKLHWLPVQKRLEYKILLLTFKILNNMAPDYLRDLINVYTPKRILRSSERNLLCVPSTRLKSFGDKAFGVIAPKLWNGLPEYVKDATSLNNFKVKLKTFLFKECYDFV